MKTTVYVFLISGCLLSSCKKEILFNPESWYNIEFEGSYNSGDSTYDYNRSGLVFVVKETADSVYFGYDSFLYLDTSSVLIKTNRHLSGQMVFEGYFYAIDGVRHLTSQKITGTFYKNISWQVGPGNVFASALVEGKFSMIPSE